MLDILGLLEVLEKATCEVLKKDNRTVTINRVDFFKACNKAFERLNKEILDEFKPPVDMACVNAVARFGNMIEEELFKDKEVKDE